MSLKGYYKKDVITVTAEQLIPEAAAIMRDYNVGGVVVTREQAGKKIPIGLLTDRDITINCVANNPELLKTMKVEEAMTHDPICAKESWGVYELVQTMRQEGVARMPIVSDDGILLGIVTAKNIFALLNDEFSELVEIGDKRKTASHPPRGPLAAKVPPERTIQ
jgi:CBS domain-containing protein